MSRQQRPPAVGAGRAGAPWTRAALPGVVAALLVPGTAAAHQLLARYESPLPLAVYIGGAAVAVALSFAFVALRAPARPAGPPPGSGPVRIAIMPRWLRLGLRCLGLVAWLWIVIQTLLGGTGDSDVASLFLWTYGWIGVAMISALIGPVWAWLDPFATLYDLGAAATRRLGVTGWHAEPYPRGIGRWPAVAGFAIVVWLELVANATGGSFLAGLMIAYTIITLAAMGQFGRDRWLHRGELFSVWFLLLGRIAPLALEGPREQGRLRVRRFASGLLEARWSLPEVVLVGLAVGSILYDGVSQTAPFATTFGTPNVVVGTLLLAGFVGGLVALVLMVTRGLGLAAVGSGLLPIATGYLIAHYLTSLLIDGQRILVALSDPFQQGWDLLGHAHIEPDGAFLPAALVWTVQIGAVVGGHIIGAWAGHRRAPSSRALRLRQLPLALLMVVLTSLTLWSLGQAVVHQQASPAALARNETASPLQEKTGTLQPRRVDCRSPECRGAPRLVVGSSRAGRASPSVREETEVAMATGTVKKIVSDRGFGFITAEDGKDYFFHRDALEGSLDFDRLSGGESVTFDVEQSPRGPRASKVKAA